MVSMVAVMFAIGTPANAGGNTTLALVCTGPPATAQSISIKCDGTLAGKTQVRVAGEFCSGTGCTWRFGGWVNFNSGNYSTASDPSLYRSGLTYNEYR